jgi:hypothetical protein
MPKETVSKSNLSNIFTYLVRVNELASNKIKIEKGVKAAANITNGLSQLISNGPPSNITETLVGIKQYLDKLDPEQLQEGLNHIGKQVKTVRDVLGGANTVLSEIPELGDIQSEQYLNLSSTKFN